MASRPVRRLLALILGAVLGLSAADLAIVNGTIIDGLGRKPYPGVVLIRDGRIAAVGPAVAAPSDAETIDATGKTVLPGLFDLHTHAGYAPVSGFSGGWGKHLAAYLYCGVTSIVDFGLYPEMFAPMRRLLAEGVVEGPRVHMAARVAPPYGHGMEGGRGDFFSYEVFSKDDARAAMERLLPYKPDVLKIFTDGWRYGYAEPMADMAPEPIAELVKLAHAAGVEVLTHTVTVESARWAAEAGVDVIDHGVGDAEVDEELIELLRENEVTYAPTLAVYHPKGRDILTPLLATVVEPEARARVTPPLTPPSDPNKLIGSYRDPKNPRAKRWEYLLLNNRKLHEAGVRFGVGTDAGVTNAWHGWATLRELRLLVHGGLTPLEAIRAATLDSARALNVDHERGSLEAGKLADLLVVDGAPHEDIAHIERVWKVFLSGKEVDRGALAKKIAAPGDYPLPTRSVPTLLDDFELEGRRSRIGTNWVNRTDSGLEHAELMFRRTARKPGDHVLTILARMSNEAVTWATADLPLSPGGVEPVDLTAYKGVRFRARGDGDGDYRLVIATRSVRDYGYHFAPFEAGSRRLRISVPFSELSQPEGKQAVRWTGRDAVAIQFRIGRAPGESAWLEIDDVELYR